MTVQRTMNRFDLHRENSAACQHAVGLSADVSRTLLLSLSTIADAKFSNPPWVNFQSAGWVSFQSAPTAIATFAPGYGLEGATAVRSTLRPVPELNQRACYSALSEPTGAFWRAIAAGLFQFVEIGHQPFFSSIAKPKVTLKQLRFIMMVGVEVSGGQVQLGCDSFY